MRMMSLFALVVGCGLLVLVCIGSDVFAREIFFNVNGRLDIEVHHHIKQKEIKVMKSNGSLKIVDQAALLKGSMSKEDKNSSLDDKRVVPTGPNPLHNR